MFCIGHQLLIGHARGEITAKHIGRDRGGIVHVGKIGDLEVDFVVEKPDGTEYYQVAASVRAPSTMERELAPFSKIRDHHPKFLLTLDEDPSDNINGIRKLNALDWLLQV